MTNSKQGWHENCSCPGLEEKSLLPTRAGLQAWVARTCCYATFTDPCWTRCAGIFFNYMFKRHKDGHPIGDGHAIAFASMVFLAWLRIRSKPSCAKARALLSRHACTGLPTTIFWNLFPSVYVPMTRGKTGEVPEKDLLKREETLISWPRRVCLAWQARPRRRIRATQKLSRPSTKSKR